MPVSRSYWLVKSRYGHYTPFKKTDNPCPRGANYQRKLFEKLSKAINRKDTRSVQVILVFVLVAVPHFIEQSTNNETLNFSNNIAAAAAEVPMDIERAFDTIRHPALLHVLSRLISSVSVIKLNIYFISSSEFKVSVEGDVSMSRYKTSSTTKFRPVPNIPQTSKVCIKNCAPRIPGTNTAIFAGDTCI